MTEIRRKITGPAMPRDFIQPHVEGKVPALVPFAAKIRCHLPAANTGSYLVTTGKPSGVWIVGGGTDFEASLPTAAKEIV